MMIGTAWSVFQGYDFGIPRLLYKVNQTWENHSKINVITCNYSDYTELSLFQLQKFCISQTAENPRLTSASNKWNSPSSVLLPVHTCIFPTYQVVALFRTIEPSGFHCSESVFEGRLEDLSWIVVIVFVVISIIKNRNKKLEQASYILYHFMFLPTDCDFVDLMGQHLWVSIRLFHRRKRCTSGKRAWTSCIWWRAMTKQYKTSMLLRHCIASVLVSIESHIPVTTMLRPHVKRHN